ncbi:MAG: hypothetical protein PF445_11960 [Melioribacteraceae bacterium]|jgi:hypothetical protein|nr:hypothetical protein [Melioribacteraceae bacterium]
MKYSKEIFIGFAVIVTVFILFMDASNNVEEPKEVTAFNNWAFSVIDDAKADSSYVRIPLDSKADQRWFMETMYKVWDKEITIEEFIKIGLEKFPNNKESFEFVADRLPR